MNIHSRDEMRAWGAEFAQALKAGDVILLEGQLGVGKSELARAIIQTLTQDPELDVPSPSFTLVQSYEARTPVLHFDLYRLSSADELIELGIPEIFENHISLVEWPERLGQYTPKSAIAISIEDLGGEARKLNVSQMTF